MKRKLKSKTKPAGRPNIMGKFEEGVWDIDEFHDVFLAEEDLTEYKPAIKLVGSWEQWESIKNNWPNFSQFLTAWKHELEVKLKSRAMQKILEFSNGDDQKALMAAKFFATKDYNREAGKGRPSKKEQKAEAKELAKAASETAEERKRIEEILSSLSEGVEV